MKREAYDVEDRAVSKQKAQRAREDQVAHESIKREHADSQDDHTASPEKRASDDRAPFVFVAKNGCCKDCMKAFSKSGKSCLCQVPKAQRRTPLSENGCKFCGCKGCNRADVAGGSQRPPNE